MKTIEEQALLLIEHLADNYAIAIREIIDNDLLRIYIEDDMVFVSVAKSDTSDRYEIFEFMPEISDGLLRMIYFESMYNIIFYDKEWNEVEPNDITINVRKERMNNLLNEI